MARPVERIGENGITQNARRVAEAIGIDHVAVWRWLRGITRPSRMARERLFMARIDLDLPPRRPRPTPRTKTKAAPKTMRKPPKKARRRPRA